MVAFYGESVLADEGATDLMTGSTALHYSAQQGSDDLTRELLNLGADLEKLDANAQTILHVTASTGQLEVLEMLIEKGAMLEAKDIIGRTPLQVAVVGGHAACVRALHAAGALLEAVDYMLRTSIHLAASSGKVLAFADSIAPATCDAAKDELARGQPVLK
eukprot:gene4047-5020_t